MWSGLLGIALVASLGVQDTAGPSVAEQLDAVFLDYARDDMPGMAVAVIHRGRVIHANGFGMANLEHGVPNTPETIYRIGSTSKQFTAMCIAMLHLQGELDLDDDIRKHLPELPELDTQVTIRHLVHHTSGLPDYPGLHMMEGVGIKDHVTPSITYARLTDVTELNFEPGTQFAYSNSNYFLMSQIVQRVTGKTLREFAHASIFQPLGMDSTHYHDRHDELVPGRADGYSRDADDIGTWRKDNTTWDHVGDGGVFTTVLDLAKWDANFSDNQLAGGQELIELVLTQGELEDGTKLPYAFGLGHGEYLGKATISHSGGWVGFRAEMIRFPKQQLSVVVLSNCGSADPSHLAQQLARKLL